MRAAILLAATAGWGVGAAFAPHPGLAFLAGLAIGAGACLYSHEDTE